MISKLPEDLYLPVRLVEGHLDQEVVIERCTILCSEIDMDPPKEFG
jgi:hypothetical protein